MNLAGLKTNVIGRNVVYFKEIDSTQLEAWRNKNLHHGSLIIADRQTKGKGTHGRVWKKECETDIAFSLKVDLNCHVNALKNITQDIAKMIIDEFYSLYDIKLDMKLPNDIMKNGKKLGGILTETKVIGSMAKEMVVGIGINLHKQEFAENLKDIATSIENEYNIKTERIKIIVGFCNRFEQRLNGLFES